MLYSIFLYQTKSGILLFDKSFQDISKGKLELFSSFFSAIKSFIQTMLLEGSKDLKNIELGNYLVKITTIPEIIVDLVLIIDQEDNKKANKMIPKIIKILLTHKELFMDWDGNVHLFKILDHPITELIASEKDLLDEKTLTDNQIEILKSIWARKGELLPQELESILKEKQFLEDRLNRVENLIRKKDIIEKILEITHQLKDDEGYLQYQKILQDVKNEINDTRFKIRYYIKSAKESLSNSLKKIGQKSLIQGDYRDTYLNLYSFGTKIQKISSRDSYQKYKEMANLLLEKDESRESELSQAIKEILNLKEDNIEEYL